jgi:hypothetical protein
MSPLDIADNKVAGKCYDPVTDGSVSRWSFHTAWIDPTAPANARCGKNVVVRSFVFFQEERTICLATS